MQAGVRDKREEVDALCDSWMGSNDKVEREREMSDYTGLG